MNVLLVYPEFPDTFWSFKHALKLAHKKGILASIGPPHACRPAPCGVAQAPDGHERHQADGKGFEVG